MIFCLDTKLRIGRIYIGENPIEYHQLWLFWPGLMIHETSQCRFGQIFKKEQRNFIFLLLILTDCVDGRIKMYYTCNDKLMYGENNGAEYFKI